ncbi:MAG: translation initiation factor IF-1 [Bacteroidales bacterium]
MEKKDSLEISALVMDSHPGGMFTLKTEAELKIIATVSGKIRQNFIKILVGDKVIVELSPYDTSRGRIVKRLQNDNF